MKLLIISGRSGSGKSICLDLLEDLGFYCIDNLPSNLIPTLAQELPHLPDKVAISIDARNLPPDPLFFNQQINTLKHDKIPFEIIYLDASSACLIQRFSETRRKHPLTNAHTTLEEAIAQERQLLDPISQAADWLIDTTHLSSASLRAQLTERLRFHRTDDMSLLFESFGYKFGIPADADYVFDARCLPNPYWHTELRALRGFDPPIVTFMEQQPIVQQMFRQIQTFLDQWLPHFESMNRSYVTIAIGCTGGQHRSVYLTHVLGHHYQSLRTFVHMRHRELKP